MNHFNPLSLLSQQQYEKLLELYKTNQPGPNKAMIAWLYQPEQANLRSTLNQVPLDHGYFMYAVEYVFDQL
jgi:hypothetical protein